MASCAADFQPKVCEQLQTRPSAGDCGPCAVIQSLYIASCGRFRIGNRARRIELIERIRAVGGSAASGSSKVSEAHRAFTSTWAANQFAELGLRRPRATLLLGKDFDSIFKPHLVAGKWAHIGAVYGPIDDWNGGAVSGQPGYDQGHALVIGRYRMQGGNEWVTMVDPLADGRRAGIAEGPQAIRLSAIEDAMGEFAGSGNATAYVFQSVSFLPGYNPDPDPEPLPTITVPDIVDVAEATALASIASAGLLAGFREEAYHASIASGNVISSDPVASTVVDVGAEVDYVVSLGTAPSPPTDDPDPPSPCDDTLGFRGKGGCGCS
jgi:hypothetical protein